MGTSKQFGVITATAMVVAGGWLHGHLKSSAAQIPNVRPRLNQASESGGERLNKGKVDPKYHFDAWTTDNGLPQNSISSILQTRDGFLWLTTNDGLVRYDGVRFTVFNAGNRKDLKSSRFSKMVEDRAGSLWIVTEDSKLLSYTDGLFVSYTTADGLPEQVQSIRNEDGALVAENSQGTWEWREGKFAFKDSPAKRPNQKFGFPSKLGGSWYFDQIGLQRLEHGRVAADVPIALPPDVPIKRMYEDSKGVLWVGTLNSTLIRFEDGKFTYYSHKDGLPDMGVSCIHSDRRGNVWLGYVDGVVVRLKDGRFTSYGKTDGLTGNGINTFYEDREGILWIATTGGLNRLRDNIITSYTTDDGVAENNIYPICQDQDGTFWIGSWGGLTKFKDGVFTRCDAQFGMAGALFTALMSDSGGGLWVASYGGWVRRFKDGSVLSLAEKEGLPGAIVRAICEDRQGVVWFGTNNGLARYKDGVVSTYTTKDGLPANAVNLIFEDSSGSLWIGTQAGLCRYRDGLFNTYPQEESLSQYTVRAAYEDKQGTLWIGTYDRGLTRLKDGRFTNFTKAEGLFSNGVFQILEDARENFWISCNLGIYRVSKKELNDYAEGRVKTITSTPYGKRDGMLNSECNGGTQPAGIKSRDGKLWFPTQGGIAVVDPEAVPVSTQPPPVMIDEFLLDNKEVAFRETVKISPGMENFEIHYTGLSFIMSEQIRFRYILEGLDKEWVEAGTRRVAYYSHVPPGSYIFRVIAANRDGVWNMEGAAVQVRIIPPFWKTAWFFSLAVASLVAVALLGYRRRIARLEKARRAQEAFSQQLINSQENERQRIAAELHDGLGQHLIIIKNSALLALNALQQQDRGKEQLGDISETASLAIDEVREISYNLRPYQLDDLGLTKAIEFILGKVAASSEIEFTSRIDSIDGLFSPEAEINIYRIVQESLNNIAKHSRASTAKITIERNNHQIGIIIQDNGCGFNQENSNGSERRGGFGLKGIAERARMLGARVAVESAAGEGTTIALNVEAQNGRGEK